MVRPQSCDTYSDAIDSMFFVQLLNEGQIWLDALLEIQPLTEHASLYSLLLAISYPYTCLSRSSSKFVI